LCQRTLDIEDSELLQYIDKFNRTNSIINDQMDTTTNITNPELLKLIERKKENQDLSLIIETIQQKQYEIIEQDLKTNFIVQGVAGSGKTVVLLHRLSYLKFNHPTLHCDRVKILVPNDNFSKYIQNLSHELEIEAVQSQSITRYYLNALKAYDKSRWGNVQIVTAQIEETDAQKKIADIYTMDFSLKLSEALHTRQVSNSLKQRLFSKIFKPGNDLIWKEIKKLANDIDEISNLKEFILYMRNSNRVFYANVAKSDWYDELFSTAIKETLPDIVAKLDQAIDVKGYELKRKSFPRAFGSHNAKQTTRFEMYVELLIQSIIFGAMPVTNQDRYLMIDEAQDHSATEYKLLSEINDNKVVFNLYGDSKQLLLNYRGMKDWDMFREDFKHFELNENYRNTYEVSEFTKETLNLINITSLGLSGKKVEKIDFRSFIKEINADRKKFKQETVAIIGNPIYLQEEFPQEFNYFKNLNFLSVMEAKGLQYKKVYVVDEGLSENEKYVSYTRTLEDLTIIHKNNARLPENGNEVGVVYSLASNSKRNVGLYKTKMELLSGDGRILFTTNNEDLRFLYNQISLFQSYVLENHEEFSLSKAYSYLLQFFDYNVEYSDLENNSAPTNIVLNSIISFISAINEAPIKDGLLILGEMSLNGKLSKVDNFEDVIKKAISVGATHLLIPIENIPDFSLVPYNLFENVTTEFYSDANDAIKRAFN
jgi:DNA helicase IV